MELFKEVSEIVSRLLLYAMMFGFVFAIVLRVLIVFTVRRGTWFAKEFDKRVSRFLENKEAGEDMSFFVTTKQLLEKTFYELFEIRSIMKRRKPDFIMAPIDRIFFVKQGCAVIVKDVLKQIRFLKRTDQPPFPEVSKTTFEKNPCFNNLFGIIPADPLNDLVTVIPSLMVIAGILGTFMGIRQALPELNQMDLTNPAETKLAMDTFLAHVTFAMNASIMGIIFCVLLTIFNTLFSPEKSFVETINRMESSLFVLWNRSTSNDLPINLKEFDEDKDALVALAEAAVEKELQRRDKNKRTSTEQGQKAS